MKTVQEIFSGIIEGGIYESRSGFMSLSLKFCLKYGLITDDEYERCFADIAGFVGKDRTLHCRFVEYGWPYEVEEDAMLTLEVRLKIYKNWSDRQVIFDEFVTNPANKVALSLYKSRIGITN